MTKDQEKFLMDFADKGLAEIKEAEDREKEIAKNMKKEAEKTEALAELEVKHQAEKEELLAEFE